MSHRVLAIVEGQTELSVLNNTVAPYLGTYGIFLCPKVIGKPGHKGGVYRSFESVSKEIVNLFKQEPNAVVTTFCDFYGMPESWPGVAESKAAKAGGKSTLQVAAIVEAAWSNAISDKTVGLMRPAMFIPYVQMYELEALLFTGPKEMADVFLQPKLAASFQKIVDDCGGCEEINDRPQLAPSKRIEELFPGYRKGRDRNKREDRRPHAPVITARIGMPSLRAACPHFDAWVTTLESVGNKADAR